MASSSQAASALREASLLLHLKRLPSSHGLTFPELFFNPVGQPKRQLSSAERLEIQKLDPDLRNLYLNDSGSSAPRRCFALVRGEELLLFAVTPERLVTLGSCSASMGDRSLFVSCDRPLLQHLFPAPLWEAIAALSSSEELLIAEYSPIGALRSWEGALAPLITTFPELKEEVDLNARDSRRRTALHRAVLTGKVEEAAALIEAGAEKDAKDLDGKNPLHLAAAQGDRLMVEALLDSGCDPLALTSEGENLLHLAVSKESLPLVDLLLQRPQAQTWLVQGDSDGKTPLHRAMWGDPKTEIANLLLSAGAPVNAPSRYGYTALHWAAKHGHFESGQLLLAAGAQIDRVNQNGESPIDLALRWGHDLMVWLLLGGERGALPHFVSQEVTPSGAASSSGPSDPKGAAYSEFERAYEAGELLPQLFWLQRLGGLHLDRREYLEAAHCLNGALHLLLSHPSDFEGRREPLLRLITSQIERVEGLFLEERFQRKSPADHRGYLMRYRTRLESIRSQFSEELTREVPIDEAQKRLTQNYQALLIALIDESIELIGQGRPSGFAVMGLGSMARMEICPYSDLEFAFLVKEPSEARLDYFRKLSQLLTLKMVNMGETHCELVRFKRGIAGAEDRLPQSLVPTGFSLDIGGLSPSGKPGVYELIGTPDQLAQFQTVEWLSHNDSEIILVNALTLSSYLTGERGLVDLYQEGVDSILNTNIGGWMPWSWEKLREERAFQLMRGFVYEFQPRLDQDKIDLRAFDVKKELYRLPQTVISGLALYYGLKGTNTLERIEELRKIKVLSQLGSDRLKAVFKSILKLRAQAHLFYRTEREIFYHPRAEEIVEERLLTISPELGQQLLEIYRTLIPLHEETRAFLNGDREALAQSNLYNSSIGTYDDRLRREPDYESKLKTVHQAIALNPDSSSLSKLGLVHLDMGQAQKALLSFQEAYLLLKKEHGDRPHPSVADSLNNLGNAYYSLGKYRCAIDFYKQSLAMKKLIYDDTLNSDVASSLNNLGSVYQDLGDYLNAIDYYKQAYQIYKKNHRDSPPSEVARNLMGLGNAYLFFGNYERAIDYQKKFFDIYKEIHGDALDPDVAMSLKNLGNAYQAFDDYECAIHYYEQSLQMYQQIHRNQPHPDVAANLNNLGNACQASYQTPRAIEYYQQSLAMYKLIHHDQLYSDSASSLNNLGAAYYALGKTPRAIDFYEQSLAIYKQIHVDRPHPDVAASLNNLGLAYSSLGETRRAIDFYEQSLAMLKRIHGDRPHPDVARNLNNLGNAYSALGEYPRAIDYYQQSLAVHKEIHEGRLHLDIAKGLNDLFITYHRAFHPDAIILSQDLSSVYLMLSRYGIAIDWYKKILAMNRQIHDNRHHLDSNLLLKLVGAQLALKDYKESIYTLYPNTSNLILPYPKLSDYKHVIDYYKPLLKMLKMGKRILPDESGPVFLDIMGKSCFSLFDYWGAIGYFQQSYQIYRQIHGDRPHLNIASSLMNLGNAYYSLGEYQHAIEYHEQSLEIYKQIHGDRPHPNIASSLNNLGVTYKALGKYRCAIKYHKQSLAMKKLIYDDQPHLNVAGSLNNLGNAYYSLGEYQRAIEYHKQSLVMKKRIHAGRPHPDFATSLSNLGVTYNALGKTRRAIDYYKESLAMLKLIHADRPHPDVANSLANLGNTYLKSGDRRKEALECLESAYQLFLKTLGAEHPHTKRTKERLDSIS